MSAEFWAVYLEQFFFSLKFAFSESRISIFEHRIFIFLVQNLLFLSTEFWRVRAMGNISIDWWNIF